MSQKSVKVVFNWVHLGYMNASCEITPQQDKWVDQKKKWKMIKVPIVEEAPLQIILSNLIILSKQYEVFHSQK